MIGGRRETLAGLVATLALPAAAQGQEKPEARLTLARVEELAGKAGLPVRRVEHILLMDVDEPDLGYKAAMELEPSERGEWLHCRMHLAPIEDLTRVPAAPLLSLLAANDELLGMSFAYHRASGRLLLHATVPAYGFTAEALQAIVQGVRRTAR